MKTRGWVAVMLAFLTSAVVGATAVVVEFAVYGVATSSAAEPVSGWWVLLFAGIYAFAAFLIGLLVIGTPVWMLMSGLGRRSRLDATVTGVILSAVAGFVVIQAMSSTTWSWGPLAYAGLLFLPGAAAGWTLHRVAYGKTPS